MPAIIAAHTIVMSDYDVRNALDDDGQLTRDSLEQWLCTHTGDFQSISDFEASIEVDGKTVNIDWAKEDSDCIYSDCVYGGEE